MYAIIFYEQNEVNMIIDTHAHIIDTRLSQSPSEVIAKFFAQTSGRLVVIGTNPTDSIENLRAVSEFSNTYATIGIHPIFAEQWSDRIETGFQSVIDRVVAIGEIGLDYSYAEPSREIQKRCFVEQMQFAERNDLPVVIHTRDAIGDTMEIIRRFPSVVGIVHCYGGSLETARELIKLGYYLGIGGVITFRNARNLQSVIAEIGIDRVVLETDSPYLTPEPNRGKVNEPSNVVLVAKFIADLIGKSFNEVCETTTKNAIDILKLDEYEKRGKK